jgi:hypothetical protein
MGGFLHRLENICRQRGVACGEAPLTARSVPATSDLLEPAGVFRMTFFSSNNCSTAFSCAG